MKPRTVKKINKFLTVHYIVFFITYILLSISAGFLPRFDFAVSWSNLSQMNQEKIWKLVVYDIVSVFSGVTLSTCFLLFFIWIMIGSGSGVKNTIITVLTTIVIFVGPNIFISIMNFLLSVLLNIKLSLHNIRSKNLTSKEQNNIGMHQIIIFTTNIVSICFGYLFMDKSDKDDGSGGPGLGPGLGQGPGYGQDDQSQAEGGYSGASGAYSGGFQRYQNYLSSYNIQDYSQEGLEGQ